MMCYLIATCRLSAWYSVWPGNRRDLRTSLSSDQPAVDFGTGWRFDFTYGGCRHGEDNVFTTRASRIARGRHVTLRGSPDRAAFASPSKICLDRNSEVVLLP